MPNWIEGTLKIRGPFENVRKFLEEGIEPARAFGEKPNMDNFVELEDFSDVLEISIFKDAWIKDTNRAFLDAQDVTLYSGNKGLGYVCMKVRQAWGFVEENWIEISEKFGVEMRLYGIEGGMGFDEMLEVNNGELVRHEGSDYNSWDDFFWRCPFPGMGG